METMLIQPQITVSNPVPFYVSGKLVGYTYDHTIGDRCIQRKVTKYSDPLFFKRMNNLYWSDFRFGSGKLPDVHFMINYREAFVDFPEWDRADSPDIRTSAKNYLWIKAELDHLPGYRLKPKSGPVNYPSLY